MFAYDEEQYKKRKFRFPDKPMAFLVLILVIVLALVTIALLPTILVLLR